MGLGVVLLAVAIFAGVFFLILSCGRLFEWCCGDQGSFNGEKLVTGKRYGTRNIYARLQRTEADRAVAEALRVAEKASAELRDADTQLANAVIQPRVGAAGAAAVAPGGQLAKSERRKKDD